MTIRRLTFAAVLPLLVAMAACTAPDPAPPAPPASVPAPAASSPTPSGNGSAAQAELPILATREVNPEDGLTVTIALHPLRVAGEVMTVTWSATGDAGNPRHWSVNDRFSDGVTSDTSQGDTDMFGFTADGVYVVDHVNAKRHLPARDPDGRCVCSSNLGGLPVVAGGTQYFSAVVRAVPVGVETVSVYVPMAGMFDDVAVSR